MKMPYASTHSEVSIVNVDLDSLMMVKVASVTMDLLLLMVHALTLTSALTVSVMQMPSVPTQKEPINVTVSSAFMAMVKLGAV